MSERAKQVLKYFEEQKDFFNARVKCGIELYRKGTARIRVVDENGEPVKGALIEAKQTEHDFKFGSNLFHLDELETTEKNEIYKEKFAGLFNQATLPFYWNTLEPDQGKPRYPKDSPKVYRRPAPDLAIEYCREKGIEPKLHCLNYDQYTPDWARNCSTVKEYKEHLSERFRQIGERYAKLIPMIEVTNETFLTSNDGQIGTPFFWDDDFLEWSYLEAKKYFPANKLVINEAFAEWDSPNAHTNRNPYYMQIEKLLSKNIPLHGIGLQYHSIYPREDEIKTLVKRDGRYSPMYMYAIMDKLSELNLPLQITEITIPAYSCEEDDEALQAELIKNVYSMFFSQKNMEGVIYWNIPDGYHHGATPGDMTSGWNYYHGGLLRFDMSEKPAYKTLKKLIYEDWTTNAQIVTDEDGYATLRGFHGEYELTVHANEKQSVHAFRMGKSDLKNEASLTL